MPDEGNSSNSGAAEVVAEGGAGEQVAGGVAALFEDADGADGLGGEGGGDVGHLGDVAGAGHLQGLGDEAGAGWELRLGAVGRGVASGEVAVGQEVRFAQVAHGLGDLCGGHLQAGEGPVGVLPQVERLARGEVLLGAQQWREQVDDIDIAQGELLHEAGGVAAEGHGVGARSG